MCGVSGFLARGNDSPRREELTSIGQRMADAISHRGPDAQAVHVEADAGMVLSHRRLKVIDLSETGAQPMCSSDGRYVLAYNGEIYNYPHVRKELVARGVVFRGTSDTEVLLEAVARWGVTDALRRANGMFAIALWDRADRTLTLARDRMGEKPLYYGWSGGTLLFGSELRAIRAFPGFSAGIDLGVVHSYVRMNCVPAPLCIYEGFRKVPPGSTVTFHEQIRPGTMPDPRTYWSVLEAAHNGLDNPLDGSDDDVVDQLEALLDDAVGARMIADVPLGAFLSGGIDSSLIVALMQRQSGQQVQTFTIGFDDPAFDESPAAAAIATHLGTDHTELRLTAADVTKTIPELGSIYDEPFADSSQAPTLMVAQLARRHVTVALSGDGGDELFAGYERYIAYDRLWRTLSRIPAKVRRGVAAGLRGVSPEGWDAGVASLGSLRPAALRTVRPGPKIHRLAGVLAGDTMMAGYRMLMSQWDDPSAVVIGGHEPNGPYDRGAVLGDRAGAAAQLQYLDQTGYLPDDILTKVDRAAMAVSLETRIPLLDHRIVEFSWRLPPNMRLRNGQGKWILREVLARHVPRNLFERPKMGFAMPIGAWLRGGLRDWVEDVISPTNLRRTGLLDPDAVQRLWRAHLQRDAEWVGTYRLWNVLMLQTWADSSSATVARVSR